MGYEVTGRHCKGYEQVRAYIDKTISAAQERSMERIEKFLRANIEQYAKEARLRKGTKIEFTDAMGCWSIGIEHGRRQYELLNGAVDTDGIGRYYEESLKRVFFPLLQLLGDYARLCDDARGVSIECVEVIV